jgi:hypothetical protein
MTKLIITDAYNDVGWAGDTLPDVLRSVQAALEKYGPLSKLYVGTDYEGCGLLSIEVCHLETDEQEAYRMERQAASDLGLREARLKMYETLKKEFDGE